MRLSRRFFLQIAGVLTTAVAFLRPRTSAAAKLALEIEKYPDLKKVGGAVLLKVKDQPVVFIRDSEDSVRAFDPTCTHKKCTVDYKADEKKFHCKCHQSAYNIDGVPLGGPAPKPLVRFRTKLAGDRILIEIPDKE